MLGTLANGIVMVLVVEYVVWDAVGRLGAPHPIDAGLVVTPGADRDALISRARSRLSDTFGIDHATLQVEAGHVGHESIDVGEGEGVQSEEEGNRETG